MNRPNRTTIELPPQLRHCVASLRDGDRVGRRSALPFDLLDPQVVAGNVDSLRDHVGAKLPCLPKQLPVRSGLTGKHDAAGYGPAIGVVGKDVPEHLPHLGNNFFPRLGAGDVNIRQRPAHDIDH